jgi:hypothetical protein
MTSEVKSRGATDAADSHRHRPGFICAGGAIMTSGSEAQTSLADLLDYARQRSLEYLASLPQHR